MCNNEFIKKVKYAVMAYENIHNDSDETITESDVIIVWLSKIIQNNKALVITNRFDGTYYELTNNGDKDEIYLDVYKKVNKVIFKNEADDYYNKEKV